MSTGTARWISHRAKRRRLAPRGLGLAAALLVWCAATARADTFPVGPGCSHTTLASAVLAAWLTPGDDLIKITAALTNQAALFDDFAPGVRGAVTVRGGYTSCADATSSGRTVVDGTATQAVVTVETTSQSQSRVILENLELSGGLRGVSVAAGGELVLRNVRIADNEESGAYVGPDGTLTADGATEIVHNGWLSTPPAWGGGISCVGGYLDLDGAIEDNRAENGAGVAMSSGCVADLRPGASVSGNEADFFGGGFHLGSGSLLVGDGDGTAIEIAGNSATSGGGIYAVGSVTVLLQDASLSDNFATEEGGALHAHAGAQVHVLRNQGCEGDLVPCNRIVGNELADFSTGTGTAVYASDAFVRLSGLAIRQNSSGIFTFPTLLYVRGATGELQLENLAISGNWADILIWADAGATVFGGYLSSTRNVFRPSHVPPAPQPPLEESTISVSGEAGFYSSIFMDHGGFSAGPGASLVADCLLVSTMDGIAGGTFVLVADPQFLDPDGGNLHLPPTSPAVDYCDEAVYPFPGGPDGDGETRDVDHPSNPDGSPGVAGGRFDIGYDEVQASSSEIFSDGFESGSTGAWDLRVP